MTSLSRDIAQCLHVNLLALLDLLGGGLGLDGGGGGGLLGGGVLAGALLEPANEGSDGLDDNREGVLLAHLRVGLDALAEGNDLGGLEDGLVNEHLEHHRGLLGLAPVDDAEGDLGEDSVLDGGDLIGGGSAAVEEVLEKEGGVAEGGDEAEAAVDAGVGRAAEDEAGHVLLRDVELGLEGDDALLDSNLTNVGGVLEGLGEEVGGVLHGGGLAKRLREVDEALSLALNSGGGGGGGGRGGVGPNSLGLGLVRALHELPNDPIVLRVHRGVLTAGAAAEADGLLHDADGGLGVAAPLAQNELLNELEDAVLQLRLDVVTHHKEFVVLSVEGGLRALGDSQELEEGLDGAVQGLGDVGDGVEDNLNSVTGGLDLDLQGGHLVTVVDIVLLPLINVDDGHAGQ